MHLVKIVRVSIVFKKIFKKIFMFKKLICKHIFGVKIFRDLKMLRVQHFKGTTFLEVQSVQVVRVFWN